MLHKATFLLRVPNPDGPLVVLVVGATFLVPAHPAAHAGVHCPAVKAHVVKLGQMDALEPVESCMAIVTRALWKVGVLISTESAPE
jgi:hypothetical protein